MLTLLIFLFCNWIKSEECQKHLKRDYKCRQFLNHWIVKKYFYSSTLNTRIQFRYIHLFNKEILKRLFISECSLFLQNQQPSVAMQRSQTRKWNHHVQQTIDVFYAQKHLKNFNTRKSVINRTALVQESSVRSRIWWTLWVHLQSLAAALVHP